MDSWVSNLSINILEPTQIHDNHLQYRYHMKIHVGLESVGSMFKNVVLVDVVPVDPDSIHLLGNYLSDPSQLIFHAMAYCTSCSAMRVPNARRRCDPLAFSLQPSIESPIAALTSSDGFNTRCSQIPSFKIPPQYRRPSNGQSIRCDQESLMYVFPPIPTLRY